MLKDAVEMATRELIPAEPEPVLCGAPNYSDRCELPVGHEGRHAQGIMSWPAGTGRPVTPEPVNPFAPKRTPQEWADAIKALIAEADADGSELWVEYVGGAPRIRIGPPDSTGADDPIIWGSK
jgi:hypothetical protein